MPLISRPMLTSICPGRWTLAHISALGRPKRRTIGDSPEVYEFWPIEKVLEVHRLHRCSHGKAGVRADASVK